MHQRGSHAIGHSVPVWLKALCLNVTIPALGREPLGRVASTVVTT
jgi:hypothetical protein